MVTEIKTTVSFEVPEDIDELKKFEEEADMEYWKRSSTTKTVTYTLTKTFFKPKKEKINESYGN